jgi:hypothetical protein
MSVECAWCGLLLAGSGRTENCRISHSICPSCADDVLAQIETEADSGKCLECGGDAKQALAATIPTGGR